ncbi:MAG: PaaI family thioesterase [Methylococcaceae bacterium]|nr:PaaI family thioesterase [Methylococcaceae bacterium]
MPSDTGMDLPPRVFSDMEGEFIDLVEGISLTARFPNKDRYMNPMGFMQGGIITAAIDNTVSPLSFMLGSPNVTQTISTTFKRPIKKTDRFVIVKASMIEKTETHIVMQAEVKSDSGKLMANGVAKCVFIKNRKSNENCP